MTTAELLGKFLDDRNKLVEQLHARQNRIVALRAEMMNLQADVTKLNGAIEVTNRHIQDLDAVLNAKPSDGLHEMTEGTESGTPGPVPLPQVDEADGDDEPSSST